MENMEDRRDDIFNTICGSVDYKYGNIEYDWLLMNCIEYALENSFGKINYIARDLFDDVLPEGILEMFDNWTDD